MTSLYAIDSSTSALRRIITAISSVLFGWLSRDAGAEGDQILQHFDDGQVSR